MFAFQIFVVIMSRIWMCNQFCSSEQWAVHFAMLDVYVQTSHSDSVLPAMFTGTFCLFLLRLLVQLAVVQCDTTFLSREKTFLGDLKECWLIFKYL